MLNVLDQILPAWRAGQNVALSTVVAVLDSAPLPVGTSQLVTTDRSVHGSVSGGCVEGVVYESNLDALEGAEPSVQTFTVSDDEAFSVGLTCGGTLEVFTEVISRQTLPWLEELAEAHQRNQPLATATVVSAAPGGPAPGTRMLIRPDSHEGSLEDPGLEEEVLAAARELLDSAEHGMVSPLTADGPGALRVFVQAFAPKPRLLVFGAVDFAAAVAETGRFAGYRVTVCDARPVFLTPERFPHAHEIVLKWPHVYLQEEFRGGRIDSRTAICVLTHDAKFDVPLLEVALRDSRGCYVGAMGSRRTHEDRLQRLREHGLDSSELDRLHSPIGLDLGGSTAQHVAISIIAEVLAHAHGRGGQSLRSTSGAIHARRRPGAAVGPGDEPTVHPKREQASTSAGAAAPAESARATGAGAWCGTTG